MADDTDRDARKARADAIRAKVKQLKGEAPPEDEDKPMSPREFVESEMAKRKKREKKPETDAG